MRLWHNPRCSKSRQTLALLQEHGAPIETYLYLETPPDRQALDTVLTKLGLSAAGLIRKGQAEWKTSGLNTDSDENALRNLMVAHPILIERPILETNDRAAIGRPPEEVLGLL